MDFPSQPETSILVPCAIIMHGFFENLFTGFGVFSIIFGILLLVILLLAKCVSSLLSDVLDLFESIKKTRPIYNIISLTVFVLLICGMAYCGKIINASFGDSNPTSQSPTEEQSPP